MILKEAISAEVVKGCHIEKRVFELNHEVQWVISLLSSTTTKNRVQLIGKQLKSPKKM